jgi:uncharacterized protein (DUF4415 family)
MWQGQARAAGDMTMFGKRTKEQAAMVELERLQDELEDRWIDRSLPDDWQGIFSDLDLPPEKTRVTVRLDADMVRWFRKMGPGYGRLINRVLRVYWTALLAGHIKAYYKHDTTTQGMLEAHHTLDQIKARRK